MSDENGSYDWEGESHREYQAPPCAPGPHTLTIKQIRHTNRDGLQFLSKHNEEQILLIFSDENHCECCQMVTLSESAGWTLAKLLGAAGVDLADMKTRGLTPKDFADPAFAEAFLTPEGKGISFRARVSYRENPNNAKRPFTDVVPLRSVPKDDEQF